MGKRILIQRRGKGGIQFRAPSQGKIAPATYPAGLGSEIQSGAVVALTHERGRGAPLMRLQFADGGHSFVPAVVGVGVGSRLEFGQRASLQPGNVLPLRDIPEGTQVCNLERSPGGGGQLARVSGASALVLSQTPAGALVRLPSGKSTLLRGECRAMVGVVAGGGRREKPFLRAGSRFHAMRAKGHMYPRVRGIAMAAVYHPFGGGRHQHPGKSTSTPRNAPPGRKVGLIAPRKTGRKRISRAVSVEVK
jgi:large subunit ribosomal protein L2